MNRIFRSTLALLAVLAICAQVSAMQPSVESKSYSDLIGRFDQAPSLKLEPLDYAKLAAEDLVNDSKSGSMRFAVGRDVNVTG